MTQHADLVARMQRLTQVLRVSVDDDGSGEVLAIRLHNGTPVLIYQENVHGGPSLDEGDAPWHGIFDAGLRTETEQAMRLDELNSTHALFSLDHGSPENAVASLLEIIRD